MSKSNAERRRLREERLTRARLKELLTYDESTGIFRWLERPPSDFKNIQAWKLWRTRFAGSVAGWKENGYIRIEIDKRAHNAGRLAFLYMLGRWPADQVDHINHVRDDNRWENLREVVRVENAKNQTLSSVNTSGRTGVSLHKRDKKWQAFIKAPGKHIVLGHFESFEDACLARAVAEKILDYHPNHGAPKQSGGAS